MELEVKPGGESAFPTRPPVPGSKRQHRYRIRCLVRKVGRAASERHAEPSVARVEPNPQGRGHVQEDPPHPWARLAGKYADDPLWDETQRAIRDFRRELDLQGE